MAAAIVPLIETALPILEPYIKSAALHLEHLFGGGGTGPTKMNVLVQGLTAVANALSTAGKLPGNLDASSLAAMAQSVVSAMLDAGTLNPQTAAVAAGLPVGTTFQVTGTLQVTK